MNIVTNTHINRALKKLCCHTSAVRFDTRGKSCTTGL